jgi:Male sterility protein
MKKTHAELGKLKDAVEKCEEIGQAFQPFT